MKEFLKKLPMEYYMGFMWMICAMVVTFTDPTNRLEYSLNIILGFMALFTGTVLVEIRKFEKRIFDEVEKIQKEEIE